MAEYDNVSYCDGPRSGEALRLFAETGYERTTVEDISDVAVSWTDCEPVALELLDARPDDEPHAETMRHVILDALVAAVKALYTMR